MMDLFSYDHQHRGLYDYFVILIFIRFMLVTRQELNSYFRYFLYYMLTLCVFKCLILIGFIVLFNLICSMRLSDVCGPSYVGLKF